MLSQDEIRIKAGLDYSKVTAGLTTVGQKVRGFASDIKSQLVGAFAASQIIGQLKETIDWVEQLAQRAEGLGISKSFLQDLENIGNAAGKSSEQMQQLITKFAATLQPGANIELEFMAFLDQIKNAKDPVERTTMAFDRLGKSGVILLDVAKDGSASFKELSATFDKLSDSEVNSVLKADSVLDKFANRWKIFLAKIIVFQDKLERFGNMEQGSAWRNLAEEDRIAEMQLKLKEQQRQKEYAIVLAREKQLDLAKKDYELRQKEAASLAKEFRSGRNMRSIVSDRIDAGWKIEDAPPAPIETPAGGNKMFEGIYKYYGGVAKNLWSYGLKGEADKYGAMADAFFKRQRESTQEKPMPVKIVEIE